MSKFLKIIFISVFIGLVSGLLSSLFLLSLSAVTSIRSTHPLLIWGLPVFGLFFGLFIKKIPHHINQGVPYILSELENPEAKVSVWMTPFIFLSSLGTHLFGGSAGREGVGVIMGASAAHLLPKFKKEFQEWRAFLIYAGGASGFAAIFGTPFAAILFAFELHNFKNIKRWDLLLSTTLSSVIAFFIPDFMGVIHQQFTVGLEWNFNILAYVLLGSLAAGLGGQFFYWGLKGYTQLISRLFPRIEWKLMVGGLLISFLVYFTGSYDYVGIGTDMIEKSFVSEMSYYDFVMKGLLTIMTISVGFKGGEVTPLFFMGATFSNGLSSLMGLKNFALSSSLGMMGLFGAVSATPIASAVMGAELFGPQVGVLCLMTCLMSRALMGKRSVYRH